MPLEELTIGEYLTYQEYPVKILDTSEKVTQNNCYKMCKVQWSNHTEKEATWEKDQLKAEFPDIFSNLSESQGRVAEPNWRPTFFISPSRRRSPVSCSPFNSFKTDE
jgi:hypothetical protein